jgi:hypothetical protein
VKRIRSAKDKFVFHFNRSETKLLSGLLRLYPCIPPAHQPLSKGSKLPEPDSSQRLLDESLAAQRAHNARQLAAWLGDPRRFVEDDTGCKLWLSSADLECLLQVLNDIRVGSWVRLGSPEDKLEKLEAASATNKKDFWAMEMAGFFQMSLLEAVEGTDA